MIYFVQPLGGGDIKIGTTKALQLRLPQLRQPAGPRLVVLGIMDGSFSEERQLHRRFRHLGTHGEWFRSDPELLDFIATHTRPWTHADDCRCYTSTVSIPADLVHQVKTVALLLSHETGRRITIPEYFDSLIRLPIEREHAKLLKRLAKGDQSD